MKAWKVSTLALTITVICNLSATAAAMPYTPEPGTADRAAIMDSIRRGTESDSIFVVDYLKVTNGEGAKFAFAEVHPASASARSPFRGWVILKRETGERWQTLWGVDYDGYGSCHVLKTAYMNAVELASRFETSMMLFSREFRRGHLAIISRADGSTCKGSVVVNNIDP